MATKLGPNSCALGPHSVGKLDAGHLCGKSFASATIYYPKGSGNTKLASVVIIAGMGDAEGSVAAWAPFVASHGMVAMTIAVAKPWTTLPPERAEALVDASKALQAEHTRAASPLHNRLDPSARAVMGYSLGGGGAQLAAVKDPQLKCCIALNPHSGTDVSLCDSGSFPDELSSTVPVLIICTEKDDIAEPKKHGWIHYRKTSAPSLIFEVSGGDHYTATGPAGGEDVEEAPCVCCNMIFSYICSCAPCPCGTMNTPSGHATNQAPRGAIGGMALAWLQLFLLGDKTARARLETRPDCASGFESKLGGAINAPH